MIGLVPPSIQKLKVCSIHLKSDVSFLWFSIYSVLEQKMNIIYEPQHDKTNKMVSAPSEVSDQPGHPPRLLRAFAVHSMGR